MAFPDSPLPLRVALALDAEPAADPASWVWTDVTTYVRVEQDVEINVGRLDEGSVTDASSCRLTVDNRDGRFTTDNPLGAYYGRIRFGTPMRVGTVAGAAAFSTAAASGWGVPDSGGTWTLEGSAADWSASAGMGRVALAAAGSARSATLDDCTGRNVEGSFVCSAPVVATGGPFLFGLRVRENADTYFTFLVELGTAGGVTAKIVEGYFSGETTLATSGVIGSFTYTADERIKVRCQADGQALRMRVWQEADPEPSAWTITATDTTIVFPEEAGAGVSLRLARSAGNTNTGSRTLSVDDVEIVAVEFTGPVVSWPSRWDLSANDAWAPIEASGPLRRLSQGAPPIYSAIRRYLGQQNPIAYLPLEDPTDAETVESAASRSPAGLATNMTMGSDSSLPGSAPAAQFRDNTSKVSGYVRARHTAAGFTTVLMFKLSALPSADGSLAVWRATGRIRAWKLWIRSGSFKLTGYDEDDNIVFDDTGFGVYTVDPTQWTVVSLTVQVVGANVEWDVLWHQASGGSYYARAGTVAGTTEIPYPTYYAFGPSLQLPNASIAHAWIGPATFVINTTPFTAVVTGHAGESATDRIARLAAENGERVLIEDGTSTPMGPQEVDTFLGNLRAVEKADGGILAELGTGFLYRPSGARQFRAAEFEVPADALAEPPEPTNDDQRYRNDWTLTRSGGGRRQIADAEHIARHGHYPDGDTVNVANDDLLAAAAGWRTHLGTVRERRYPSVVIDFTASEARDLLPAWRGRQYGPRFTISGMPTPTDHGDPDLIVEGYRQILGERSWTVHLNCSPARPYDARERGFPPPFNVDSDAVRDTAGSELAAGVTAGATSLSIATTLGPLWSTNPNDYPRDWFVGGEQVTVSAVSGTSSPQTATVSARAVNGVSKAHDAGAIVRLWTPTVRAL